MPNVGSVPTDIPRLAHAAPADAIFKNSRRELVIEIPPNSIFLFWRCGYQPRSFLRCFQTDRLLRHGPGGDKLLRPLPHHFGKVNTAVRRHRHTMCPVDLARFVASRKPPKLLQTALCIE